MSKILVVEDEPQMALALKSAFEDSGYEVQTAGTGREGLRQIEEGGHDLAVLDLMLPGMNGFEVLEHAREHGVSIPIIVLTARDAMTDRVKGLDIGADDYLVKPFKLEELLARVRVQLRRKAPAQSTMTLGDLTLDVMSRKVKRGQRMLYLSGTEFSMLELLMRNAGKPVSKAQLLQSVWNDDPTRDPNIVEVYASYLRQKLEVSGASRILHTVRGQGYMLALQDGL